MLSNCFTFSAYVSVEPFDQIEVGVVFATVRVTCTASEPFCTTLELTKDSPGPKLALNELTNAFA